MTFSVEINGPPEDLQMLRSIMEVLPGTTISEDETSIFVTNTEIGSAASAQLALERADALFETTARAGLILYGRPLKVSVGSRVKEVDAPATTRIHHVARPESAQLEFTTYPVKLTPPGRRPPKDERVVYTNAQAKSPRLAQALQYILVDDNEYGFYKAFEVIRDENGGFLAMLRMGWATEEEFDGFMAACHKERHDKPDRPKVPPMTERKAREFVLGLLKSWAKRIG